MALVQDEGQIAVPAELIHGPRRPPIERRITVERPRGMDEPTWYGSFTPRYDPRMLPGTYESSLE